MKCDFTVIFIIFQAFRAALMIEGKSVCSRSLAVGESGSEAAGGG